MVNIFSSGNNKTQFYTVKTCWDDLLLKNIFMNFLRYCGSILRVS